MIDAAHGQPIGAKGETVADVADESLDLANVYVALGDAANAQRTFDQAQRYAALIPSGSSLATMKQRVRERTLEGMSGVALARGSGIRLGAHGVDRRKFAGQRRIDLSLPFGRGRAERHGRASGNEGFARGLGVVVLSRPPVFAELGHVHDARRRPENLRVSARSAVGGRRPRTRLGRHAIHLGHDDVGGAGCSQLSALPFDTGRPSFIGSTLTEWRCRTTPRRTYNTLDHCCEMCWRTGGRHAVAKLWFVRRTALAHSLFQTGTSRVKRL